MSFREAVKLGYSADKRKRRRQHRQSARCLLEGGYMKFPDPARIFGTTAKWHLDQARYLGR